MRLHAPHPRTIVLHPGQVACCERGDRMETLLGSCVAILLTDPDGTTGAMCHVVHPGSPKGSPMHATSFGDAAIAEMARQLRARCIDPAQCLAWVYGGGNMFPDRIGDAEADGNVGAANVKWALTALHTADIRILGVALGGHAYRKLRWTVGLRPPIVETVSTSAPPQAPALTPALARTRVERRFA